MNATEAQLILQSYRADGRYAADDPLFAEALALARTDPALTAWLARESAFDEAVAGKLEDLAPPAGLRESIVMGARLGRTTSRSWWRRPVPLAAAAAIVLAAGVTALLWPARAHGLAAAEFAQLAIDDFVDATHAHVSTPAVVALGEELGARPGPLDASLTVDTETMRRHGCRSFTVAGREVFEICFVRHGTLVHLFVARSGWSGTEPAGSVPAFREQGGFAVAAWTRGEFVYALAANVGSETLRRLL